MCELLIKETADGSADSICCSMSFTYSLVTLGTPARFLKLYVMTILSLYKITSRTNVFIMSFLTFKSVVSTFTNSYKYSLTCSAVKKDSDFAFSCCISKSYCVISVSSSLSLFLVAEVIIPCSIALMILFWDLTASARLFSSILSFELSSHVDL